MSRPTDQERAAIEHDRDLAWELYGVQPTHPRIPELAGSVLAREPTFTGMIILTALHREACGEIDEARRLLQNLMGRRDRQYLNSVKKLRDLEMSEGDFAEARRLSEIVLREQPDADWIEHMELGSAMAYTGEAEAGWRLIDEAVGIAAAQGDHEYSLALGQRATRLFATAASPERLLPAAEEAYAADPTESLLALTLGYAYLCGYRPEDALALFERVLREDPTMDLAQYGVRITRGFLEPIRSGAATMDTMREAQMGEYAWRRFVAKAFRADLADALAALDEVMPEDLAAALRPPLDREAARASGGEDTILAWHDGQEPGTGGLWGAGERFRLMTGAEVAELDDSVENDPAAWGDWEDKPDYFQVVFTDDAGDYLLEGVGGKLYHRSPGVPDVEVAPSPAEWIWDRVAAFGGHDPRPGRHRLRSGSGTSA
ncbi:tetratricopeptide repeat protein [Microbacterium sp. M28]|uniref:tetratricopeptide repeat protein n=1 Tax=Microbacterium sp. M28 TaxID=2962064 RepID=UPI0021F45F34|nr:tetratricopeptide repeat protein [Microbacterium sp. M28]UYO97314.1 tetratricopeptide repeat protein [Microbacterium sp. M28]